MKPIFDRNKLEFHTGRIRYGPQPTKQFWEAEMERCKNPLYLYNNYWTVNGKAVKPMTQKEWDMYHQQTMEIRYKRMRGL